MHLSLGQINWFRKIELLRELSFKYKHFHVFLFTLKLLVIFVFQFGIFCFGNNGLDKRSVNRALFQPGAEKSRITRRSSVIQEGET